MPKARTQNDDADCFGAILLRLRQARGWTYTEFGRVSGMHPTYLAQLERGENVPSLASLFHLSDVLGIDPVEVFREIAENRKNR